MNNWTPETPPTPEWFLTRIVPSVPVLPVLAMLMAVLYLAGTIRLWRQGRRWSVARTICFLIGCIALNAVTGLAVDVYGYRLFSVFMFQQLT